MKKIIAAVLSAIMLISLSGCKLGQDDIRGTQTVNSDIISSAPSESEQEFSLGTIQGLKYENKFIGIGLELDSNWQFYTDEQIKQLNNVTQDIAGEEYVEMMKDANVIYDMFVAHKTESYNVNVNLEKVNPIQLATLDIKKNYEAVFPSIKTSFENMGYTNISYTIEKIKIDGKDFVSLITTADIQGVKMYQKTFAKKCNGYLANVTVTTVGADYTNQIIEKMYLVK